MKNLVELHGGTVQATSAGEGHGTTITVQLPLLVVHRSEGAGSAASVDAGSQRHILSRQNLSG